MKRLARFLIPVMIAVTLGPLIGGLVFCLLAVYTNLFDQTGGMPIADLFGMFGIYIIFAYIIGGPIALVAGILVSIWMIWRPPYFPVVVVAAIMAIGLGMLADEIGMFRVPLVSNNLWLMTALGVIAASLCWLLTRPFWRTG